MKHERIQLNRYHEVVSDRTLRSRKSRVDKAALLRASWGQWIAGQQWTHFVCFTFRSTRRRVSADRVSTSICCRAWRASGRSATAVVVGERGGSNGRYHLHGLLRMADGGCDRVIDWWRSTYGWTDDRKYDSRRGAAGYVAKYILKEQSAYGELAFSTCSDDGQERRNHTPTPYELRQRTKAQEKNTSLYFEIAQGQKEPLGPEEKAQIWKALREENLQIARRYRADCPWLDEARLSGYDRYLAERQQL